MDTKDWELVKKQIEGLIKDAERTIEINKEFLKAIDLKLSWKLKK